MSYEKQLFVNDWGSTIVDATISTGETTIHISPADSAELGPIAATEYYVLSISNGSAQEVVWVTGNDEAGTITVLRGREGTTPLSFVSGNAINGNITKGMLGALQDHASRHLSGGADEINGDQLDIDFTPSHYTPGTTLAEHLSGIDNALGGWMGVSWNESTDVYTRRGSLAGQPNGVSPGDALLPIQSAMKRCVMDDSGVVQYYLNPYDSTLKADGSAANLDGTDGQVMVEIPKFYIRYSFAANTHTWDISYYPLAGFVPHPAFFKDDVWVDHRYIGAYEGSMYDASEGAMCTDANAILSIYASGDKLCSVTGQCPKVNETRAEFRAMAAARGPGWRQKTNLLLSVAQGLYLVEYAEFDSQTAIGNGRTMFANGSWVVAGVGGYLGRTGYSNSDGNATNATNRAAALDISAIDTSGASYQDYMTYRGIENFFGNEWTFVDRINVRNWDPLGGSAYASYAYAAQETGTFADDSDVNCTEIASGGLAQADGYAASLIPTLHGFLPATVGASSSTKLCDYYHTYFNDDPNSGWRGVLFGGSANAGLSAGAFCVDAGYASSNAGVSVGGRLCF